MLHSMAKYSLCGTGVWLCISIYLCVGTTWATFKFGNFQDIEKVEGTSVEAPHGWVVGGQLFGALTHWTLYLYIV